MISSPFLSSNAIAIEAGGERISIQPDFDLSGELRGPMILNLAELSEDSPSYTKLNEETGLLRMPSMIGKYAQAYADLSDDIFKKSNGTEKVVVVDLRNNKGGLLYYQPLLRWFSQQEISDAIKNTYTSSTTKKSYLSDSLRWGILASDRDNWQDPVVKSKVVDLANRLMTAEHVNLDSEVTHRSSGNGILAERTFDPTKNSKKPIILLLINNGCASNCEALAGILGQFPNVLVAGTNSYGVGEFGAVGDILLPHSRIRFRIATSYNKNFQDGRSFEGYGAKPAS